ncbi:hypothetical protein PM082_003860 [Marasmius tenuissimus]|nr:hypothetical protein PM082_003860 [Marasmius tenuissimus]
MGFGQQGYQHLSRPLSACVHEPVHGRYPHDLWIVLAFRCDAVFVPIRKSWTAELARGSKGCTPVFAFSFLRMLAYRRFVDTLLPALLERLTWRVESATLVFDNVPNGHG